MQKLIEGDKLNLSYVINISPKDSDNENPTYAAQVIQLPGIFLQGTLEEIKRDAPKVTEDYLLESPEVLEKLLKSGNKRLGLGHSGYGLIVGLEEFSVDLSKIHRK